MHRIFTLVIALSTAVPVVSASDPPAPDSSLDGESLFLEPMPKVLTATRLAQRQQDAPASIFVIDRAMIEASGIREIEGLLSLAPGFLVAHDGWNSPAVGYHGLIDQYGRRMLVQVDGRAVYDPLFGGVRWADLPLTIDDVEQIEVVRGANSASYGANAFLGVVNITTRAPLASQGVQLIVAAGEPSYNETVLRHGFNHGELFGRYTLAHDSNIGFTKDVDRPVYDSQAMRLATLDLAYQPSVVNHYRLQAGLRDGELEFGRTSRGVPDPEDPPRSIPVTHAFLQLDWEHQRNPRNGIKLKAYVTYRDYDDFYRASFPLALAEPVGTIDTVLIGATFDQRSTAWRYAVEVEQTLQPVDALRLAWGGELRRDEVDAPGLFRGGNPARNDMVRLFANLEWQAGERTVVNGGGMLEHHSITGTDFSPRLGINWQVHPRHTLRLSASRSVRVPSLFENSADQYNFIDIETTALDGQPDAIFQEWRAAEDLSKERVDNLELGWLFDLSPAIGLSGDVKLFYERYKGLLFEYHYPYALRGDSALCDPALNPKVDELIPAVIDALERDRSANAWRKGDGPACNVHDGFNNQDGLEGPEALSFANMVELDIYGAETSIEWRPDRRSRVIASYSIARTRNLAIAQPALWNRDFTDRDGNWLDKVVSDLNNSVPSHIFSALAIYRPRRDLTLSAGLYHVSKADYLEDGDTDLPSYTRLDLRIAKRFRLSGNWHAEVYGVAQNLTSDYEDFEEKNIYETRVQFGVKFSQ